MSDKILQIRNLSVTLGDLNLFSDVNFEVEKNKISIILGPNGTGKTTMIKTLAKVLKAKKGNIQSSARSTFYLPQKITYPVGVTLFEYLSSIFFNKGWKWYLKPGEKEKINEVLKELELLDKKDVMFDFLSAGETQKANIALGLLSGADLLLLDEPTSNMDLINQMKILDILKHLKSREVTSVVILHDLNMASNYGDNFIGINSAREVICASKHEFFTQELLEKIYGLKFKIVSGEKNIFVQTFS